MIYMPHWPKPIGSRPKDFSLDRIKSFLNKLGNPEKKIPPIIHIAGTNGKGSTLSFIRYIMQAAGYKVHTYTSPHLVNFNERIVVAGNDIDDSELHNSLEECRIAVAEQPITLFEAATTAAFLAFSRHKADITLVEVGLGGRLDATNVIDNPILTIITSIALDHTEYLGPTVETIAGEKAGIMKPNVPCVIAPQEKSIMNTLEQHAINKKSPLYRGGFEWNCEKQNNRMVFQSTIQSIEFSLPSLKGDHQIINSGNAIAACSILSGKYGFNIGEEDIASGLQSTYWPARLESIKEGNLISLLPKDWQLFLDGAHNNDGARVLAKWVRDNFAEGIYMIFGVTRNRNVAEFLEHLKPYIKLLCAVCVKSEPKATSTDLIREGAHNIGINAIECESIRDAISNHILKASIQNVKTILICGSLFLARDLSMENSYQLIQEQ
ncbi:MULTISPECIES: bifunctional folylpolyglutamate synthase/dihydrofolate synthase [unclassified Wolbachia]|uniref:bifunctional folylpolyglutamate synthase/dihydrofolate synthase n=1 Tax=unclassified Wolbachia TaxID=2640676 RepID=UPI0001761F8D|nr:MULTISPECIES: folylpolyglutamate synthase/dihydrofolate synthase family protein [unclassified Wolbachia]QEK89516.1 bifunctional folylpolyglutamate synthase/dihydrofolate synthase [Wolbachia endosymbiont of Chrysomya megacephala]UXX39992.1 bifunctional folylpolyglutamate synthase/dihydrofolate synthase [Wolbachia endosymbiont of Oryzaephilus surinamensis]CAQ55055.1 folylpolyglutamate synthase [Wolbachia endosymbiont of Culex quinquefasciatus Pel]CQD09978.1 folylpolyglutamate synthase [Wolbach